MFQQKRVARSSEPPLVSISRTCLRVGMAAHSPHSAAVMQPLPTRHPTSPSGRDPVTPTTPGGHHIGCADPHHHPLHEAPDRAASTRG